MYVRRLLCLVVLSMLHVLFVQTDGRMYMWTILSARTLPLRTKDKATHSTRHTGTICQRLSIPTLLPHSVSLSLSLHLTLSSWILQVDNQYTNTSYISVL